LVGNKLIGFRGAPEVSSRAQRSWRIAVLAALLAAAILERPSAQEATVPKSPRREEKPEVFSVLSYNVHGLFWPAAGGKRVRMPAIGKKAGEYDLVLFQEDFLNGPHQRLASAMPQFPAIRGHGPGGGLKFLGSGLTTSYRGDLFELVHQDRRSFRECYGWVRLASLNDCWSRKGFLHLRLRIASGAEIDVINLHMDAGGTPGDLATRTSQLRELHTHIARETAGRALIIAGDFNVDVGSPEWEREIVPFLRETGLRDAEARPGPGLWKQRLEHVFYRSGSLDLELLATGADPRFVAESKPLSDHPAVYARFGIRKPRL
jgi:endonuclease/exonuclease/phosphatase family metal-dependent hydrolase